MITCAESSYGFADWPTYAPMGSNVYVNGSCQAGYQATDTTKPAQRLCLSTGAYQATLSNPCIRTSSCRIVLTGLVLRKACAWLNENGPHRCAQLSVPCCPQRSTAPPSTAIRTPSGPRPLPARRPLALAVLASWREHRCVRA